MTTTRQRRTSSNTEREQTGNGATTGYEAELWQMADALRGSMDAAEYKHVVLGLIFLKYISDAFEERHAAVLAVLGLANIAIVSQYRSDWGMAFVGLVLIMAPTMLVYTFLHQYLIKSIAVGVLKG